MKKVAYFVLMVAFTFVFLRFFDIPPDSNTEKNTISVEEVMEKQEANADIILLDVRTTAEFNGPLGHLDGAILIPVNKLQNRLSELEKYKEKEIIVYCRSGNRSNTGMKILRQEGYNAFNMLGGMRAYRKAQGSKQ